MPDVVADESSKEPSSRIPSDVVTWTRLMGMRTSKTQDTWLAISQFRRNQSYFHNILADKRLNCVNSLTFFRNCVCGRTIPRVTRF